MSQHSLQGSFSPYSQPASAVEMTMSTIEHALANIMQQQGIITWYQ